MIRDFCVSDEVNLENALDSPNVLSLFFLVNEILKNEARKCLKSMSIERMSVKTIYFETSFLFI